MGEAQVRGKSIAAIAKDVAEGYLFLNPLVLKKLEPSAYKRLHHELKKAQNEIRGENFPLHDTQAIRQRNMRLQRLHSALTILEHTAKEKKIILV